MSDVKNYMESCRRKIDEAKHTVTSTIGRTGISEGDIAEVASDLESAYKKLRGMVARAFPEIEL